ncbi:hypothetical protein NF556_05840 [Ornithinimicrobium faecis]|uniref:Uncharacterized protein n=1 Tax=Ornithinimicrobium faecis TaxID=2934158 RepID=A0ABY4YXI7_9MICO|nr:hypothetical protein [Ornithinimicrobium sp. HY1793]USQ81165.1 hypothetical protein NF556_05840 [Ornithinimicrobium sp. HY1793]
MLMVVGAFTNDEGPSRGVLEMGIVGLLVWAVTAVLTARSSRRRGWGSYLAISGTLAWILGVSMIFGTSVQV